MKFYTARLLSWTGERFFEVHEFDSKYERAAFLQKLNLRIAKAYYAMPKARKVGPYSKIVKGVQASTSFPAIMVNRDDKWIPLPETEEKKIIESNLSGAIMAARLIQADQHRKGG